MFTTVFQGIHDRNITRNIQGTICWTVLQQGVVYHFGEVCVHKKKPPTAASDWLKLPAIIESCIYQLKIFC